MVTPHQVVKIAARVSALDLRTYMDCRGLESRLGFLQFPFRLRQRKRSSGCRGTRTCCAVLPAEAPRANGHSTADAQTNEIAQRGRARRRGRSNLLGIDMNRRPGPGHLVWQPAPSSDWVCRSGMLWACPCEIVCNALPLWHGVQLAIDTTLVSTVPRATGC